MAGGNRFCFRASELRVGFSLPSETSVSEAKVAKISFVFREISLKNRKTSNHEYSIRYYNILTYTYWKKKINTEQKENKVNKSLILNKDPIYFKANWQQLFSLLLCNVE